ncbi:MAG TPA: GNAT family N-acetyltransferase, partial [Kofleriaceae bacterium]|nr:GNAT family N-acetyltransferase [Kofleriaceae bacterium]
MTSIRLRAARPTDAEHVWTWNAADDVRALSNDCRPIPLDEHLAWYARRIASPDPMWIVEEDGDPIGVVRIDNRGGEGRISIA